MSPIPATPMYAPSLTHLSAAGTFFFVVFFFLITSTLVYCLYRCLAPIRHVKPNTRPLRPLILSRVVSVGDTSLTLTSVNKPVTTIRPQTSLPPKGHFEIAKATSKNTSTIPTNKPKFSNLHTASPIHKPAPTKSPLVQNAPHLYFNVKLFPIEGPIKRMETFHNTTLPDTIKVMLPPAAYISPIPPFKSPVTVCASRITRSSDNSTRRDVADLRPNIKQHTTRTRGKSTVLPVAGPPFTSQKPTAHKVADLRTRANRPIIETTVKCQSPLPTNQPSPVSNHSARQGMADFRTKPRIFPVQTRSAQAGTPANALTALALASTKERVLADLKYNPNLASISQPNRPLQHTSRSRSSLRYKSVTAVHKTRVAHPGKENIPVSYALSYF
jgi:hypothetical protein